VTPGEFALRQANGEPLRDLLAEFERDLRAEIFEELVQDLDLLEGVGE
jgi:hypothetical protein